MKDYELDKSKKGQFILNYVIKNSEIIVNYANGDSVSIPNTEKNESILQESMKNQIKNTDEFKKNRDANFMIYLVLGLFGVLMSSLPLKTLILSSANFTLGGLAFLGLGLGIAAFSGINMISISKDLNDIKKNKRFLEIESEINSKVRNNENMLYNTHRTTKNIVKSTEENRVVFTINSIDKVPFSDLEQIMENIKREDRFNFEYPEVEEETKEKNLTKREK